MRGEIRVDTLLPFGHQLQWEGGWRLFFSSVSYRSHLFALPSFPLVPSFWLLPHCRLHFSHLTLIFLPHGRKQWALHSRAHPHTHSSSADIPVHQQVTPQVCRFTHFISTCSRNGGGGGRVGRSKLRQIGITTWPLGQVCFPLIHCRRPERQAASLRLKILNICRGGLENRPYSVSAPGFAMPVVLNAKVIIILAEGICCQSKRRQRINSIKYCILRILLQFPNNCY